MKFLKNILFILITIVLHVFTTNMHAQGCDPDVPSFTADLSNNPDTTWISPASVRDGNCCETTNPDNCIEFILTLHEDVSGIIFNIHSGAVPPGALFYQIDCGPEVAVGEIICLDGPGPHNITFCKPGNNQNEYSIETITEPEVGPDIVVNDGCTGFFGVNGLELETITWTSVAPGNNGGYDAYLDCTQGCDTVNVVAQEGYPEYVDYMVCGLPEGGCETEDFCDTLRVYFNSTLEATIIPEQPMVCYGEEDAEITVVGSGGTPPYTYEWSTGETAETIVVGVGVYEVTLSDTSGCPPVTAEVEVGYFENPIEVDAGDDIIVCGDDLTVDLSATVQSAEGVTWWGGAGVYAPSQNETDITYTATQQEIDNGSVTLNIMTTGNGGCPAAEDQITIIFGAFDDEVAIHTQAVLCYGDENGSAMVEVEGNEPYTFVWNDENPTGENTIENLGAGTYTVEIFDVNDCSEIFEFIIEEPDSLYGETSGTGVTCNGYSDGSVTIEAFGGTPPYTYDWDCGCGTQTVENLPVGVYNALVVDNNGCEYTDQQEVVEPTPIDAWVYYTNLTCFDSNDGSIDFEVEGGTPDYNYFVNGDEVTDLPVENLEAGMYDVHVTDANECGVAGTIEIIDPEPIELTVTEGDTLCPGDELTMVANATGGVGNFDYFWNHTANTNNSQTIVLTGDEVYTVYAQDENGCVSEELEIAVAVRVFEDGAISLTEDHEICPGEETVIAADFQGDYPPYTYTWTGINANQPGEFHVTPEETTQYTFTVTDMCDNSISESLTIDLHELPEVLLPEYFGADCPVLEVNFNNLLDDDDSPHTYIWNTGTGEEIIGNGIGYVYHEPGTYSIDLTVMTNDGCEMIFENASQVIVYQDPDADFLFSPNEISELDPRVKFTDYSAHAAVWEWDFGDGGTSNEQHPAHTFQDTGYHHIKLHVTTENGCTDSTSRELYIKPFVNVYIPNAFTPDGDGINDFFFPKGANLSSTNFEMLIFNRWGELIFESYHMDNAWDGRTGKSNEVAQQGVYVYKIKVEDILGGKHEFIGHVTLLK